MAFICLPIYTMNMTRKWSDHYKLVILEEEAGEGRDTWRKRGPAHFLKAASKSFLGGDPMFRSLKSLEGDFRQFSEANRET